MSIFPYETIATSISASPDMHRTEADDERILIVDDEEMVCRLFASCLSERYSCVTAGDTGQALEYLAREEFALVISDINMPGMSGIELLRKITERYQDTVVVMVSAIDRTQRVLDAVRLGAFDYLIKPCDLDVLQLCVGRALERRSLLRTALRYQQDLERRNEELARRQTEVERLQAHLVHHEKMASLGRLAAGVAHELNNPAGFIHGNMELLRECAAGIERLLAVYESVALPPRVAEQVEAIKKEIDYENTMADMGSMITDCHSGAERIRDVVQNLRTFSRLDEAEYKKVVLHEGIESTIRLLSRYYSSEYITLRRDYCDLPPVNCYAGQLNQVWMNLLVNAAQAIGRDVGEVCIRTRLEGESVKVSISDTGGGIAPEYLGQIFDPFFTTKPVGEGTGLGLSITYGIVERHGGTINVESRVGAGTTFTVTLPIHAGRAEGEG